MLECRYYGKCAGACDGHGLCVSFRNVTYDCEDFYPMPDVKALKGLADKMQNQQYMREDARWLRWDEAARRIREALGEVG